jgi:hypothetical protein
MSASWNVAPSVRYGNTKRSDRPRKAKTLIYERRIRAPKVENTMELFLFLRIDNINNNNIKTEQTWDKEENFG